MKHHQGALLHTINTLHRSIIDYALDQSFTICNQDRDFSGSFLFPVESPCRTE